MVVVAPNGLSDHEKNAFVEAFMTPAGQTVLQCLRKYTLEKPMMIGAGDGVALALLMAKREGENELYRWIEKQAQRGDTAP
jgi:hypothetical protein